MASRIKRSKKNKAVPAPAHAWPSWLSLLALLGIAILVGASQIPLTDIFWHLKVGEWVLAHHRLLTRDVFSFTFANEPVAVHSPLFQILVASVYQTGGWLALHGLHILLLFALAGLVYAFSRARGATPLSGIAVAFFVIAIVSPQNNLHPQLFFNLLVLLYLYVWYSYRHLRPAVPLPYVAFFFAFTAFLWGLLHPSFPFGYVLLVGFAVDLLLWHRRYLECIWLLAPIVLSGLALYLVHPNLLSNVLTHVRADVMLSRVNYWRPLLPALASGLTGFWIGFLICVVLLRSGHAIWKGLRQKRVDVLPMLGLSLIFIYMGFRYLRFFPLIFLALLPLWYVEPQSRSGQKKMAAFLLVCAGVSTFFVFQARQHRPGLGLNEAVVPVKAVRFLRQEAAGQRIFNAYNFGGYMLFAMGPETQVFIDPRSSQLYADDFLRLYLACFRNYKVFLHTARTYRIRYTFIPSFSRRLLSYLDRDPQWERVYQDDVAVIHRRKRAYSLPRS